LSALLRFLQNISAFLNSGQLPHLGTWTYLLIAVLVAFEGPATTLIGAAAASAGLLNPVLVFVFAAAGNLTSDALWYSLGRAGKIDVWKRFGKKRGVDPEVVNTIQRGINEHAMKIMFFAKLTMSFMIPTLITAGLSKVPWRRWFPPDLAGEMLWTGALVLIGYFATEAIKRVEKGIEYLTIGLSVAFILFMIWMGRRMLLKVFKSATGDTEMNQ
jgi:membrane protein DedA with SNARE-associated domain